MKFTYTLMEIFWLSIKRYKSQRKLKREREREREREISSCHNLWGGSAKPHQQMLRELKK